MSEKDNPNNLQDELDQTQDIDCKLINQKWKEIYQDLVTERNSLSKENQNLKEQIKLITQDNNKDLPNFDKTIKIYD